MGWLGSIVATFFFGDDAGDAHVTEDTPDYDPDWER